MTPAFHFTPFSARVRNPKTSISVKADGTCNDSFDHFFPHKNWLFPETPPAHFSHSSYLACLADGSARAPLFQLSLSRTLRLSTTKQYKPGKTYRTLVLECVPQTLSYTKLWFYLEFLNVSRFLGIVLFGICSQVPGRRLSDNVFASICVAQNFCRIDQTSHMDF